MQFSILGSHPNLSLAEIKAVTGKTPERHADKVAVFESLGTELSNLQVRLGGTQKLGFVIGTVKIGDREGIIDLCMSTLFERSSDKKIKFGFSVHDIRNQKDAQKLREDIERIGLTVKKQMKESGKNARLVTSKDPTLSSVVVTKNKLLQTGAEFVLIVEKEEILIGVTESVQDFEDWSHRDFDRPARDAKRGMLPPKLARIMVNISQVQSDDTLLDPFCGSGTVLMESSMIGIQKLVGNDILKRAVDDTEENFKWMKTHEFPVPEYALYQLPAEELDKTIQAESIDVIVTEPFLGTPRQGDESVAQIESGVYGLEELYKKSFTSLFNVMKSGGTVVIASPVHFVKDTEIALDTTAIMKSIGFSPDPVSDVQLMYRQKNQFVARDILRFKKV